MKLSLRYKFIFSLLILTAVSFFIYFEDLPLKPAPKPAAPAATAAPQVEGVQIFDPERVSELLWTYGDQKAQFTKDASGNWMPDGAEWAIKRRLGLVAKSEKILAPMTIQKPLGQVSLKLNEDGEKSITGIYDDKNFVWNDGPYSGKGYSFENDQVRTNMFAEGVDGFQSHHLTICAPANLERLQIGTESLVNEKGRLLISANGKIVGPPNRQRLADWLKKTCEVSVEYFVPAQKPGRLPSLVISVQEKNKAPVKFVKYGDYFFASGFSETAPFRSEIFESLTKISLKDLLDEGFTETKTILDVRKSEPERVQAIRNVKRLKSSEAVPALGKIIAAHTVTENLKYEAIDALAEIGTKDAYKLMAETLAKVSPSGTQVRLARTLAQAMGAPLKFDENTSKAEGRHEIQTLLSEYRKHPPGL